MTDGHQLLGPIRFVKSSFHTRQNSRSAPEGVPTLRSRMCSLLAIGSAPTGSCATRTNVALARTEGETDLVAPAQVAPDSRRERLPWRALPHAARLPKAALEAAGGLRAPRSEQGQCSVWEWPSRLSKLEGV